jgi:hypothetical protein
MRCGASDRCESKTNLANLEIGGPGGKYLLRAAL